ncbi:translation initiation factor IF-2 [Mycoplasmopsis columbinasalis]|uniref:Translation initiation factor IF-2 n=1 Tax=Mycoplasmopsis columbinasalis TaxID=114880 RepID=A0A449BAV5_9BACT|nr:translation initiation factor IF-2 [Mycoplasmopsis columbinasalis]VEU78326.1 translation initiation factor if-2 [Mycoplasmopsis columbinasalis]
MSKIKRLSNTEAVKAQLSNTKTEVKNGVFIFTNKMPLGEFANKIKLSANELIKYFMLKRKMYQINHVLEEEEIAEVCMEHGLDFRKEQNVDAGNFLNEVKFEDDPKLLTKRPPVVTVMGHVDHGKTTLVDYIRKTKVAQSESSGITQHTGAYQASHQNNKITFIDTPGHEAFSQMRSRGAKITDLIILVVAADDGVMPQTKEAIQLALDLNVPVVVFVNKMDKPNKNIDKIKNELLAAGLVTEEYGGNVPMIYGSAKLGDGVDSLLEQILLSTDILELKANKNRYPYGTVVESKIDRGVGATATLLIESGTLYRGDFIVAGSAYGRVKNLISSSTGQAIEEATPGMPVVITGLNVAPFAGERFIAFEDEKFAKKLAQEKAQIDKNKLLFNKSSQPQNGDETRKIINIIIRSDVQGTAEALREALHDMHNDEAVIHVLSAQAGEVSNNDLLIAQTSNALVINFNQKPSVNIKQSAKQLKVKLAYYNVLFKATEDMQALLDAQRTVVYEEKKIGTAVVIKLFKYSKVGIIAGCMMEDGVVKAHSKVKVLRRKKIVHDGVIDSLRRELNDVKEVETGKDFGTHIHKFDGVQLDDILEFYEDVPVPFKSSAKK